MKIPAPTPFPWFTAWKWDEMVMKTHSSNGCVLFKKLSVQLLDLTGIQSNGGILSLKTGGISKGSKFGSSAIFLVTSWKFVVMKRKVTTCALNHLGWLVSHIPRRITSLRSPLLHVDLVVTELPAPTPGWIRRLIRLIRLSNMGVHAS